MLSRFPHLLARCCANVVPATVRRHASLEDNYSYKWSACNEEGIKGDGSPQCVRHYCPGIQGEAALCNHYRAAQPPERGSASCHP